MRLPPDPENTIPEQNCKAVNGGPPLEQAAQWLINIFAPPPKALPFLRHFHFEPAQSGKSWWRIFRTQDKAIAVLDRCKKGGLRAALKPVSAETSAQKANRRLVDRYRQAPAAPLTNVDELKALGKRLRALPQRSAREQEFRRAHKV